jgi:hypothetical protein
MSNKIDIKNLHRAQVHLWAAYGWEVEYLRMYNTDWKSGKPGWNWSMVDYRIARAQLQIPEGYELVPIGEPIEADKGYIYLNTQNDDLPGYVKWKKCYNSDLNLDPYWLHARPIAGPSEDQVRTKTDAERIAELERRVEELEEEQ